ncbi:HD domain-containing protein [Kitasatospora sp. NPDC088351]|uniref:HD domain-containing protein n=1 Tax=unclassified Kitasatospora TaxID=2633591 RepID=UPI003441A696
MTSLPSLAPRPDTALVETAERMLRAASPDALVAHCHRTYAFAEAILARRGLAPDREALYLGAVFHDLGLTPDWDDQVTPFEERGALVARETLLREGADPELAELVGDAVRLHMELTTGDDPRPEVAGIHLGSAADVLGLRLEEIPPDAVDAVLEAYPRQGLTAFLREAFASEARRKPNCATAAFVRDFGFLELLDGGPGE